MTEHAGDDLADLFGEPLPRVVAKVSGALHEWTQTFIANSPFAVLATADSRGTCDSSPRGGPAGFVRVLDERTLLIPEQPGNKLFQSIRNLRENPGIGIVFLIPGVNETARVNGRAEVVLRDEPNWTKIGHLIEDDCVIVGIVVQVVESYYHCGRSSKLSRLWEVEAIEANRAHPPVTKRPVIDDGPAG